MACYPSVGIYFCVKTNIRGTVVQKKSRPPISLPMATDQRMRGGDGNFLKSWLCPECNCLICSSTKGKCADCEDIFLNFSEGYTHYSSYDVLDVLDPECQVCGVDVLNSGIDIPFTHDAVNVSCGLCFHEIE